MTVVYPGISVFRSDLGPSTAGTLGPLLRTRSAIGEVSSPTYALTCAHFLWGRNRDLNQGHTVSVDGVDQRIGTIVHRTLEDISVPSIADVALIKLDPSLTIDTRLKRRFGIEGTSKALFSGLEVFLSGRDDEGLQRALVSNIDRALEDVAVSDSWKFDLQHAVEVNQPTSSYGNLGDSGAAVINSRGRVVGIQTAKNNNSLRFFVRINTILALLNQSGVAPSGQRFEVASSANSPITVAAFDHPTRPHLRSVHDDTNGDLAVDVFARTLFGEARGDMPEHARHEGTVSNDNRWNVNPYEAIAEVIMNRVDRYAARRSSMPTARHIIAVCQEPWQFSCWNHRLPSVYNRMGGQIDKNALAMLNADEDTPYFGRAIAVAKDFMAGNRTDHVNGAMFYYNPAKANPKWAPEATRTTSVGNHLFVEGIRHHTYGPRSARNRRSA